MAEMEPVIGLEIHAQLNTATKLFCSCPTEAVLDATAPADSPPEDRPNSRVCEVCTGQPGALPRTNARAVELAATAGLALGCRVNEYSVFSRKNYFYPDLPAGFQTSQLDPPICEGGGLAITDGEGREKRIRLNRIHLEDDAGKCVHDDQRGRTLVDLNRAGTPLIEIVTEPDFRSSGEVMEFLKKLHNILVHLEVTKGRLEEGEFRCDVNISLRPRGVEKLGTRSEIKNLNSFRHAGQAIEYEIVRQGGLYDQGATLVQETRLFDPARQETRSLRSKEDAHDYRYFPQPDLPPVHVSPGALARLKAAMPELPEQAEARLLALGLTEEQAAVFLDRRGAVAYFDQARPLLGDDRRLAALMVELLLPACQRDGLSPLECRVPPAALAALGKLMADNTLSRRAAYDLFPELFEKGGDPGELARSKGVLQISDTGAISDMAAEIIAANPGEARKYREGQEKILSFFVGQLMKKSKGAANPKLAGEVLSKLLKS
ncbi:MAG: Asp-tRNA(Asn)/Glu-tRNA(Gln) amidotransferase subunit GatB [Candidatus Adiutrix sp.]|jgi:aspartyl-tRNA(Asn)/glutamyl-tRNA(Gln) amidotransferase subunit B|nr:Asp-tRNA(Asn)/Glu-tRNA(Gln) amidotransferase subunit GatB [Candidatus Adiutrix sp.]